MKRCINWKVVAGLAAVAIGIYLVYPQLILGAVPYLLIAACPLSMLLMMGGMSNMGSQSCQSGQSSPRQARPGLTREDRLAQLQAELRHLDEQQDALRRQVQELQEESEGRPAWLAK